MIPSRALIIFCKNPKAGNVKTRLAATIGEQAAVSVYKTLLAHTADIVAALDCAKFIFYPSHPSPTGWPGGAKLRLQKGNDLGERMENAFAEIFDQGFSQVIIIGSDCPGLTTNILVKGFEMLSTTDVVIGPAMDGGYYLLGMKRPHPELFQHMQWSTDSVFSTTVKRCSNLGISTDTLDILSDVDDEKDLIHLRHLRSKLPL